MPSSVQAAVASVPRRAERAGAIYRQHRGLFERYRGGVPAGLWAGMAEWESGGRMVCSGNDPRAETTCGGSAGLGEYGFFQVASHTEREFSVPPGTRKSEVGNFWLSSLELNVEAFRLASKFGWSSGYDLYLGARGVFSIGRSGFWKCVGAARAHGVADLVSWAAGGGVERSFPGGLGTQSPEKVSYRLQVLPVKWEIGKRSGAPMSAGAPTAVSGPMPYRLPKDVAGRIREGAPGGSLWMLAAGVLAYAAWRRRTA